MEWREHGELELEDIARLDGERDAVGVSVFGEFDGEGLRWDVNEVYRVQEL